MEGGVRHGLSYGKRMLNHSQTWLIFDNLLYYLRQRLSDVIVASVDNQRLTETRLVNNIERLNITYVKSLLPELVSVCYPATMLEG
jgi:ABC-type transport system involved in cytochrome bd biosynthesis fused ATPase/permease subunit